MKNKEDNWIIGTGFSRGIGAEVAKKIHEKGYRILYIGRNKSHHEDEFLQWDLGQPLTADILSKLRSALENKNIRGLLYCAGIIPELVHDNSCEETVKFWQSYETAMRINYFSCIEITHEVIPFLLKSKQTEDNNFTPFLAHISSLASVDPLKNLELYGITKLSTLKHFFYLSQQYAPTRIACLAIHPGTVHTDMFNNLLSTKNTVLPIFQVLQGEMDAKKVITPEQSASLIVKFLFDPAAQTTRESAHGKLYAVDSQQLY